VLIVFSARQDGKPPDELLKLSQKAISQFAHEAMDEMDVKNIFPVKGPVGRD